MSTLKASAIGIEKVKTARKLKGFVVRDPHWLIEASKVVEPDQEWPILSDQSEIYADGISAATWKRFLSGKSSVQARSFKAFCQILDLNWEEIVDLGTASEPKIQKLVSETANSELDIADDQISPISSRDWGDSPEVPIFFGRSQELATLEKWILDDACRCVSIVGMRGVGKTALSVRLGLGGVGKTDLAIKLAQGIQSKFDFIVWRSVINAPPLPDLLTDILKSLAKQENPEIPETVDAQIALLLKYLKQHRCLLILDNAETLLQSGDSVGQYRPGYENYGQLIKLICEVAHQSCLLITSREKPHEVILLEGPMLPVRSLILTGLDLAAAKQLIKQFGDFNATEQQWAELVQLYDANPLALELAAKHIQELFDGDVAEFLRDGKPVFQDLQGLVSWHFERLSDSSRELFLWLAINREPVSIGELYGDIMLPSSRSEISADLAVLKRKIPLEKTGNRFTLQPVLIEYATDRLIELICSDICHGNYGVLRTYALIKAQSKEYVREAQTRLILQTVADRLVVSLGNAKQIQVALQNIIRDVREEAKRHTGYVAGNILNLLTYIGLSLDSYNFSKLMIRQAFLQNVTLHGVDFSHCQFLDTVFTQSFGGVLSVALAPDGSAIATGNCNCDVHLWRMSDQQRLLSLRGHTNWVRTVAISPDGRLLASGGEDATVKIWNIETQQCLHTLTNHTDAVQSVVFSPDGQYIASSSRDKTIQIWSLSAEKIVKVLRGHPAGVIASKFSHDGKSLVSGGYDNLIKVWDVESETCITTLNQHKGWVTEISISPDGKYIASSSIDNTIKIWDAKRLECLKTLDGHTGWIWDVTWSHDGKTVASCGADQTIRVWDVASGHCIKILEGHQHQVWEVVFSADNETLVSVCEDQTIKLWQVNREQCIATIHGYTNWIKSVRFSADGKQLISGHRDSSLRVWEVASNECSHVFNAYSSGIPAVAFHPHKPWIAGGSYDHSVKVWDLRTQESRYAFSEHTDEVWSLDFSPDGKLLASSSFDHTIKIWNLNLGECQSTLKGHTDRVPGVAFSPDGKWLASGSDDFTVRIWSPATGECLHILEGHQGRVGTVSISVDSRLVASPSLDHTVKIWDVESGQCLRTLEGHSSWVMAAAFSPDGTRLASASCDQTVRIWHVETGELERAFSGHSNWVWSVAFSPDGNLMASASEDETMRIWDVVSGQCQTILKAKRPYEAMKIHGVEGLTTAQIAMLKDLGAV